MFKIMFRSKGSGDSTTGSRIKRSKSFLEPIVVSDESLEELEVSLMDQITRMNNPVPGQRMPNFNCTCSGFQCVCAEGRNGPSSPRESDHLQSTRSKHVNRCLESSNPCPGSSKNSAMTNDCASRRGDKRPGTPRPSPTSSCLNIPVACPGIQKRGSKPPSPSSSLSPRKIPPCQSKVTPQHFPCSDDTTLPCPASNCPTLRPDSSATSSRYQKPPSEQNFQIVTGKNCSKNCPRKNEKTNEEASGIFGLLQKITAWSPIALTEGSSSRGANANPCPRQSQQPPCPCPRGAIEPPCPVTSTPCSQRPRVSFQTPECGQVEQLFFNKGIKSDASLEFEPCTSRECQEPQQSNDSCSLDACGALNSTYPVENQENLNITCGSGSGGVSDSARAQHYHNKLMATLQILQNKEETVRVQTESLAVAEARIAHLTVRAQQMKRDLDAKQEEIKELKSAAASKGSPRKPTVDSCTCTHEKEVRSQRATVIALQNNIAVIEALYRECFYESAKQEELIELLRKSYLDVRLMKKEKAERERGTNNHLWTLQRCQEIAADVETLKMEITTFIGSSNNDSGMWTGSEDSAVTEVGEDLQDITDQLLRLKDLLAANECCCGSQKENEKLKEENQKLQLQSGDLQRRVGELEELIMDKDTHIRHYKKLLDDKQEELCCAQCEVSAMKERNAERENAFKCLAKQAKQAEECLKAKCSELDILSQKCCEHECTIAQLRQELAKADIIIKENCKIRNEVSYLTQQVSLWRSQLADSEARVRSVEQELMRARSHAQEMDQCYREKACSAAALQEQLEAAHARGAELCGEARRVVCAVRHWVRRMREKHADQDRQIRHQEAVIAALNRQLSVTCPGRVTLDARPAETSIGASVGCSKCAAKADVDEDTNTTCSAIQRLEMLTQSQEDQQASLCECRDRTTCVDACTAHASRTLQDGGQCDCNRQDGGHRCECRQDGGSIESITGRRKKSVRKKNCGGSQCTGRVRSAAVQRPLRSSVGTYFPPTATACEPRSPSPTQELYERVERLQEALVDGVKRWSRTRLPVPKRP